MKNVPRAVTLQLNNWRDFTKVLYVLSGDTWLYRGQEDADWFLQSSLEREMGDRAIGNPSEAERSHIELFRANSKLLGSSWESDIDALIAMQHHEAKTRLLDFSTSLMIALFFAFEKIHENPKRRAIYAVNFNSLCESDSLRVRYQKYAEIKKLRMMLEERIKIGGGRGVLVEDVEFRRFVVDAANEIIKNGSNENGILPLYTAATNKRQLAQAGVQLMPFSFRPFVENLAAALSVNDVKEINSPSFVMDDISHIKVDKVPSNVALIKMEFAESMEDDAWNILNQSNINAFTIYPDLIGLSKSLGRYNRIYLP